MYLTDEQMDEWGHDIDAQQCPHEDTGEEMGTPDRNGFCAVIVACYDCGKQWPTDRMVSIL